jgi:hypothetical protein
MKPETMAKMLRGIHAAQVSATTQLEALLGELTEEQKPNGCAHPPEAREDTSDFGGVSIRCRMCGETIMQSGEAGTDARGGR